MNFFAGIAIIATIKIISHYIQKDIKKKPVYVCNGKEIPHSLLVNSYNVLGLDYKQSISPEIIRKAFHKQLELFTDGRIKGFESTYSIEELQAAKAYLIDFFDYIGKWN